MTSKDFGTYLKSLRHEKNLKAKNVCEEIGLSTTIYSLYENGVQKPGIKTLKKLSEYFDVPYKEMYEIWKD